MSNHGNEGFDPIDPEIRKKMIEGITQKTTSENPFSQLALDKLADDEKKKISEDDEGEVEFKILNYEDKVILDFGKSIKWIAFTPDQIDNLIEILKVKADELR